jgi:hypothetical protein
VKAVVVALVLALAAPAHADDGRMVLQLAVGGGAIGASRGEPSSRAFAADFHAGVRITCGLHAVFGSHNLMLGRFAPDPTHAQDLSTIYLGVRWRPFAGRPTTRRGAYGLDALSLRTGLGLAHINRPPYDSVWSSGDSGPWGFSVGGALTFLPIRGHDYALGFEASDFVSWLGKGARHAWALTVAIQLDMFD